MKTQATLAEQESQQSSAQSGDSRPPAESTAETRKGKLKKDTTAPSRFQPTRTVKAVRMPTQQEFEAEKEARAAADRRAEEMTRMMAEMQKKFAALEQQLQQESSARQAAAEAAVTAEMQLARLQSESQRSLASATPATESVTAQPRTAESVASETLGQGPPSPTSAQEQNDRTEPTSPSPGFNADPSSLLWMQQAANIFRAGVDTTSKTTIPFSMTADQLPKFSAEDRSQPIKAWLRRVEDDAFMHAWSPEQKLVAARRALTGAARKWLDSHSNLSTWEEMKSKMSEAFGRQIHASDVHQAMSARRKRKDETVLTYVQEMSYLGTQGDLSEYDIRRYTINGITDDAHTRLTLACAPKESFMALLETHDREMAERRSKNQPFSKSNAQQKGLCYSCGQRGHIAINCPKKKLDPKKCYACQQEGRKAYNCPNKNKQKKEGKVNHICDEGNRS